MDFGLTRGVQDETPPFSAVKESLGLAGVS